MSGTFNLTVRCCALCDRELAKIEGGPIEAWRRELATGGFGPNLTCTACRCRMTLVDQGVGLPLAAQDRTFPVVHSAPSGGIPGETIEITGHRLNYGSSFAVKFGGVSAIVVSRAAGLVAVVVPDLEPGGVVLQVMNEHGSHTAGFEIRES